LSFYFNLTTTSLVSNVEFIAHGYTMIILKFKNAKILPDIMMSSRRRVLKSL
jgi:hypothetical protein